MKKLRNTNTLDKVKIYLVLFAALILLLPLSSCKTKEKPQPITVGEQNGTETEVGKASEISPNAAEKEAISTDVVTLINEAGTTMDTRINTPAGYCRIPSTAEELTGFLRSLSLKPAGSDVLLYDGLPKATQDAHIAVFDLDIGSKDLQQCADSVIRIYAEYYWSTGEYDKIKFHLTNGFLMEYTKWREGYRLAVSGNQVNWKKSEDYDASYDEFRNYLNAVFTYAGTLSLSEESNPVTLAELRPGDMLLYAGSPGHCVLVVDEAIDKNGNKCFLLAQGYMPAQDFHILKNPLHSDDPWYYASEMTFPLKTPLWTFEEGSLVRWGDFQLNEAGAALNFGDSSSSSDSRGNDIPAMSENVTVVPESPTSVTLLAVGDNLIHIQVVESGEQKDGTLNYDHLYSNISDEIKAADIAVINQETILGGDEFAYSGYPSFNSPTEIGDAVIQAGFDVVLQATNHTMDMGYEGVENTLSYWEKHPDITVLGINKNEKAREQIPIVEKNGIKIAMLNYTYGLNGYSLPKDKPYLIDMLDKEQMEEDIKKAEEQADFTIVFPHWGTEYSYVSSQMQKDLTQFFYEQGVDLVVGSHPHVLEPVEWIETNEDHKMLVYYSLGNFMSYQKEAPRMLGGMAKVTITKDAAGTYISDASITPIVTHYENGPADYNYAIYKLSDYTDALANRHGVSQIAQDGPLTYQGICKLAKQILGSWYQ